MGSSGLARWAPVSGIVFVALWLITFFAVVGDTAESGDSDAQILAYYADDGNRHKEIAAFFLVLAASLFFVWFVAVLRGRLAQAEGRAGGWTMAAFGAGLVAAALWIVADMFFFVTTLAVDDSSKFHLDANTFRLISDAGYMVWFSATTIAATTVGATALLSLKEQIVPKWIAWLSLVVAATMLVAFFFIPFLIFLGWVLVVSIVLIWKGGEPQAAAAAAQA